MSAENGIIPFGRDIPHDYDYEGKNTQLPTLESTVLFSASEKLADKIILPDVAPGPGLEITALIASGNTHELIRYCAASFPHNYNMTRSTMHDLEAIEVERDQANADRATYLTNLRLQLEREFTPPQNFSVRFNYDSQTMQTAADYEAVTKRLTETMQATFTEKDAANILFIPNQKIIPNTILRAGEKVREAINSVAKQYLYISGAVNARQELSQAELDQIDENIWLRMLVEDGEYEQAYMVRALHIADRFIAQGYNIRLVYERVQDTNAHHRAAKQIQQMATVDDLKAYSEIDRNITIDRRAAIANQVNEIASGKRNPDLPTNVLVLAYAELSGAESRFPNNLLAATATQIDTTELERDPYLAYSYRIQTDPGAMNQQDWENALHAFHRWSYANALRQTKRELRSFLHNIAPRQ